jgi:DNA-binding beta-propeller fold protein YncE
MLTARSSSWLVASMLAATACLPDTGGIEPPSDELIFPVGLATTPNDNFLLAVNSNFNLKYNAGTIVALDLSVLDEHLATSPDTGEVVYATECGTDGVTTVSGDNQYCFVDISSLIVEDETLRVGAFASDLEITPFGDRAVVPVRGERAITLIDVNEDGPDVLSCGEGDDLHCDSAHKVTSNATFTLPIEPYEVSVTTLDETDPSGTTTPVTLGFATHVAGGEVSLFSISRGAAFSPVQAELLSVIGGVVGGASGIATYDDETYVAGRHDATPHIAVLSVLTDSDTGSYTSSPWFNQTDHIDLGDEMYAGTDARGIAVSPDGTLAFVATRTPDALLKIDLEHMQLIDQTTVCVDPSEVAAYEHEGVVYAFVLCFLTGQVYVVDTNLMQVEVRATGSGPQAIAFDETRKLAYIANFRESSLTVLQGVPPFSQLKDAGGRVVRIGTTP